MKATWLGVLVILMLWSCAKAPDGAREEPATREPDTSASDWLTTVREAHAGASAAQTPQARSAALATLQAVAASAPSTLASRDAASVRRDLYGRAARLALDLGRFEAANALVQQGLALEGSDPFRTQLLLLAVETQRARHDAPAAAAALRAARDDLTQK